MNFREILRRLSILSIIGGATSRELASSLFRPVKEISNDLRRLRQMGFARADREKRRCRSRWGIRVYYKGFQYRYYLSEQGKSYLNWMDNIKPNEDSVRNEQMNQIAACLPSELKKAFFAYFLRSVPHKYKGPSRRFGVLNDQALTIAILQLENRKLGKQNQRLILESIESPKGYQSKIREMESNRIKTERALDGAKETNSQLNNERQQSLQTINTLSLGQRFLEQGLRDTLKLCFDSQDFLLAQLCKYAPSEEYIMIWEAMTKYDREKLDSMNAHALSDFLDNSEVSTR